MDFSRLRQSGQVETLPAHELSRPECSVDSALRDYRDAAIIRLSKDPDVLFRSDWDDYRHGAVELAIAVEEYKNVSLKVSDLDVAYSQARRIVVMDHVTSRIGTGKSSDITTQAISRVRDELLDPNGGREYDKHCHQRMMAVVDSLASGASAQVVTGLFGAYTILAHTGHHILHDKSPTRAMVMAGVEDYTNITNLQRSPRGKTAHDMARLIEHYVGTPEDDVLYSRDKALVNRLQTVIGWQLIATLAELDGDKFDQTLANKAFQLSSLCKQLSLRLPEDIQNLAHTLISPATANSDMVALSARLPEGLMSVTFESDASMGKFGVKLLTATVAAGLVGAAGLAPAAAVNTANTVPVVETASPVEKLPVSLGLGNGAMRSILNPARPIDGIIDMTVVYESETSKAAQPEILPEPIEAEVVGEPHEPVPDQEPEAPDALPPSPEEQVVLAVPTQDIEPVVVDVDPEEGIAQATPEQELQDQANGSQGRSRAELDKQNAAAAEIKYETFPSVAGAEGYTAAQEAFKKVIAYLDHKQITKEADLTDAEKATEQVDKYWLLTSQARLILDKPEVMIDANYLQEIWDLLEDEQSPPDEAFIGAIMKYWADPTNGYSELMDLKQSSYKKEQLTAIHTLLSWAAFDALPAADKAFILEKYGEKPEPTPEQQAPNEQAEENNNPNKNDKDREKKADNVASAEELNNEKSEQNNKYEALTLMERMGPQWKNRAIVMRALMKEGYEPWQAAGAVGNFCVEAAGCELDASIEQIGGGPGRGIAQWGSFEPGFDRFGHDGVNHHGSLVWFAHQNNSDWKQLDTQIEFILWELSNSYSGAGKELRQAETVDSSTDIILNQYEKPAERIIGLRLDYARATLQTYEEMFNKASGGKSNQSKDDTDQNKDKDKDKDKHENHGQNNKTDESANDTLIKRLNDYADGAGVNVKDIEVSTTNGWTQFHVDEKAALKTLSIPRYRGYNSQWVNLSKEQRDQADANRMYIGECVSYVGFVIDKDKYPGDMPAFGGTAGVEGPFGTYRGGNAGNWVANAKADGIKVDKNPQAGSVLVYLAGGPIHSTYGHVAYVEKVFDNGDMLVTQMNEGGTGRWSTEIIPSEQLNHPDIGDYMWIMHSEDGKGKSQ